VTVLLEYLNLIVGEGETRLQTVFCCTCADYVFVNDLNLLATEIIQAGVRAS